MESNDESGITMQLPQQGVDTYAGCVKKFNLDYLLQDMAQEAEPDTQRREIEEVARVIVTPSCVEIYTFDDMVYLVEFGSTKVRKMRWVNTPEGGCEMEEVREPARQYASKPASQLVRESRAICENPNIKDPFIPV